MRHLCSHIVSPLGCKVMGWFLSWQMRRQQESNLCLCKEKRGHSPCLFLMASNPEAATALFLGILRFVSHWSSAVLHSTGASALCKSKAWLLCWLLEGLAAPWVRAEEGWGSPGPQMQRGLGMDPGCQTQRCLGVKPWLGEAEWEVGGWYILHEACAMWLAC